MSRWTSSVSWRRTPSSSALVHGVLCLEHHQLAGRCRPLGWGLGRCLRWCLGGSLGGGLHSSLLCSRLHGRDGLRGPGSLLRRRPSWQEPSSRVPSWPQPSSRVPSSRAPSSPPTSSPPPSWQEPSSRRPSWRVPSSPRPSSPPPSSPEPSSRRPSWPGPSSLPPSWPAAFFAAALAGAAFFAAAFLAGAAFLAFRLLRRGSLLGGRGGAGDDLACRGSRAACQGLAARCGHDVRRPYRLTGVSGVVRGGARICGASIPFNSPCGALSHTSGTLVPPHGVEGTSTRLHGHERAGDGVSPAARQLGKIIPESLEERLRHRIRCLRSVEPAAVDPTGSPTEWVGEQVAGQGGWYRGDGVRRSSSLRLSDNDEEEGRQWPRTSPFPRRSTSPPWSTRSSTSGTEQQIFEKSVARNEGAESWTFYEGPPTANGRPGTHHIESRTFKDVFPRFRTMQGYQVNRKGGWDCHGLPVELAVEKELGFSGKADIEAFGIAEFNARCRESVQRHVDLWEQMTDRMGCWIDMREPYRTMDPEYVESVWWALKQIHAQGPARRGLPGRAVLPPLRHRPLRPRARPGLRDGHRPLGLRAVPADVRARTPARPPCSPGRPRRGRWSPTRSWPRTRR